jgi:hypothetical protein
MRIFCSAARPSACRANRTKIEKVGFFFLQLSEEEKAAHHPSVVGMFFCPFVVFAEDGSFRLFFFHARLTPFSQV